VSVERATKLHLSRAGLFGRTSSQFRPQGLRISGSFEADRVSRVLADNHGEIPGIGSTSGD
jgi:hypothetical protein